MGLETECRGIDLYQYLCYSNVYLIIKLSLKLYIQKYENCV